MHTPKSKEQRGRGVEPQVAARQAHHHPQTTPSVGARPENRLGEPRSMEVHQPIEGGGGNFESDWSGEHIDDLNRNSPHKHQEKSKVISTAELRSNLIEYLKKEGNCNLKWVNLKKDLERNNLFPSEEMVKGQLRDIC